VWDLEKKQKTLPLPTPSKYLAHYKTLHLHMKNIYFLTLAVLIFTAPYLSAQINWQSTNGPEGGATWYIYNNDDYAFYPDKNHLYRTPDGINWEQLPYGNLWPISAGNNNKVAAFQGFWLRYDPNPSEPKFVVSNDNGSTWIEGTMPPEYGTSIGTCSHGIYIPKGPSGLIYKTTDDGLTWDTLTAPTMYCYDVWATGDRLFTGNSSKIWRLATDGVSWELISPTLTAGDHFYNVFAEGNLLFLSAEESLWASKDNGVTWKKKSIPYHNQVGDFVKIGNRVYKDGGSTKLIYTDDFGDNWIEYPLVNYNITMLGMASAGGRLLGASYNKGALYLNLNDNSWQPANTGLNSAAVYDLTVSNERLWAGCGNGVFSYNLNNQTWDIDNTLPLPKYNYSKVIASPAGVLASISLYGYDHLLSKDMGSTWDSIIPSNDPFEPFYPDQIMWVGENLFVFSDINYKVSKDYGLTWEDAYIDHLIHIVSFNGRYYAHNNYELSYTQDEGITWTPAPFPTGGYITGLFCSGDRMFVLWNKLGSEQLLMTTDGVNWSPAGEGLLDADIFSGIDEIPVGSIWLNDNKYFFQKPDAGLFVSLDTCKTWLPIERPRHKIVVYNDTLYTGGFGGGVRKTSMPQNYGALSSGTVFKDDNGNGLLDASESVLSNIRIDLKEPNAWYPFWFTQTQPNGHYSIGSLPGSTDTIRPRIFSPYLSSITPPYHAVSNSGSNRDFAVRFTENITDGGIRHLSGTTPRPGFDHSIQLSLENIGTLPINGNVGVKLDPNFLYLSADPVPTAILNGDSLIWDITQFNLFETRQINIAGKIATSAPLGSLFKTNSTLTVNGADQDISNNHFVTCDTIRGSYDPNEKRVEPSKGLTKAEIAAGKPLTYTIYFQNTGTYEADRVRITDKLDTALNWQTLRLLQASHEVSSFNLLPGGLLEVVFNHIALPDSNSNEPGSHGFVQFSIERNKRFNNFQQVSNKASIYFDFNDPIITNTVAVGVVPEPVAVFEPAGVKGGSPSLDISPNPANAYFMVHTLNQLRGQGELQVIDLNGRVCHRQKVTDCAVPIRVETAGMASGIYLVRVADAQGAMVGKVDVKVD
jgi:uncharacterized repeat protein (TIGR01451 family)